MAETKKLTKKDYFTQLKEIVKDNVELVAFIDNELDLLSRKNSKSTISKTQVENENIKKVIVNALTEIGTPVTITELQKATENLAIYSNQQISALLKQLVDNEIVRRVVEKKVARFYVYQLTIVN